MASRFICPKTNGFQFWCVETNKANERNPHIVEELKVHIEIFNEIGADRHLCGDVCHSVAERIKKFGNVEAGTF